MELSNPFQAEERVISTPVDLDALQRGELVALQKIQQGFANLVGDNVLPFLAMAPYIPQELAQSLPVSQWEDVLRSRMVQVGPGPRVWERPVIWMEQPAGESALSDLRSRKPRAFVPLVMESLAYCGARMVRAGGARLASDPTFSRFVSLAEAAASPAGFHSVLMEQVVGALRQSTELGLLWSPEARAWIEAAEPFGAVLEGSFNAAVAAAKRRFELFHRRAYDQTRLRNYFPRKELDRAFSDLLDDEVCWALHFVGPGGVGKTMFIRHLAIQVAEAKDAAVSRIDFDYLNPQYPERDPLLLLKALAEEFRLDESSDSARAFQYFDSASDAVYRRLEEAARAGDAIHASLHDDDLQLAIRTFAEALAALSRRSQPVLILDTCEELAKVQPGGAVPPNVQHTLDLLDTVYRAYRAVSGGPGLRIIFSGRRPLPKLPNLKVCPVAGFSAAEALDFLQRYKSATGRAVPPAVIPGILQVVEDEGGRSPYDLDTYAAWAAVDDTLTVDKLKSSGPLLYIRERIVDRLNPTVRRVFPALATMGRFDSEVVARLIGETGNPQADLAEVLSQEWIHADSAGAVDTWRLEDLFRQRVLKFYLIESSARQDARNRLAEILPPLTRYRPFEKLTPQLFAACLDVLSDTPLKAAAWWEEMEARIAGEAQWEWAAELMTFLEPEPADPGPMTAAIFATKAAIMLHTGHPPLPAWQVVLPRAYGRPAPEGAPRLRWRATCALGSPDMRIHRPAENTQDFASLLACVESELERERAGWVSDLADRIADASPASAAPELRAFGYLLSAKYASFLGLQGPASNFFAQALAICRTESVDARQTWLDWIRPANLQDRVLLEYAFHFPKEFPGPHGDLAEALFKSPLASIDSDRLASAWLRRDLETQAVHSNPRARNLLAQYASSLALVAQMPVCRAHQAYPPFFIVLLEARGLTGDAAEVLAEIDRIAADEKNLPAGITAQLDKVLLKIVVRMRLTSEGRQIPPTVADLPLALIARGLQILGKPIPEDLVSTDPFENAELQFLRGSEAAAAEAYQTAEARLDDLGCLEARMIVALSHARHGDLEGARREALSVQPFYERLTRAESNVPSWNDIQQAAQTGVVKALLDGMGPKPAVWRPWVVRLLACLTNQPVRLAAWIRANDATVVDDVSRVATELEFVPGTAPEPVPVPEKPVSRLRTALYLILGLAIFLSIAWAVYAAYDKLLSTVGANLPPLLRYGSFVVGVPALVWLASQLPRVFELLFNLFSRFVQLDLSVDLEGNSPDLNRPLLAPSVWRSQTRWFGRFLSASITTNRVPAFSSERYSEILRELRAAYGPPSIHVRFVRLLFRLFPGFVFRRELTVDQRTAAAPWEALTTLPILVTRRVTRVQRLSEMRDWSAAVEVLTLGRNAVYTSRKDWALNFHATFAAGIEQASETNTSAGVVRILAVPVDSPSGPALQLMLGSPPATYVVRGADLASRYPAIRMCIVQCPTAEIGRRLSTDRRNAAVLKRIGAEIFSAGVPIVIVIPVLPERASDELIDEIYRVLGRRPANAVPQLEAVIASFCRKPLNRIARDPDDAQEIVHDLCLYASSSVSFKIVS
jgi:hypothetical protein